MRQKTTRVFLGDTTEDLKILKERVREIHPKPEGLPEGVTEEDANTQYELMVTKIAQELRKFNSVHRKAYTQGKKTFKWGRDKKGNMLVHDVEAKEIEL